MKIIIIYFLMGTELSKQNFNSSIGNLKESKKEISIININNKVKSSSNCKYIFLFIYSKRLLLYQ